MAASDRPALVRGDLLPAVDPTASARNARRAAERILESTEAPGINTLQDGHTDLVLAEALGANVVDTAGNRYIDLVGGFGVALLGHRHPEVHAAVASQSGRLVHGAGDLYANAPRLELARALCDVAPHEDARVYFAVSGADAVEVALKTAVLATGRAGVLAFDPGYHGLTLGALQVTSRPAFREPFARHAGSHVSRLPYGCDLARVDATLAEGTFAAVVFEPVVGREGVLFPPDGWVRDLLGIARGHGVLSVADEIFTGFRRTGPLFAHVPDGSPGPPADLVCCGKALGGGFPVAAVLGSRTVLEAWRSDGEARHTGTFVAHPVACAASRAVLQALGQPWVDERLAAIETCFEELAPRLRERGLAVRGRGALWGLEAPGHAAADRLRRAALERGLLVLAGGPGGRVVQCLPPLVISDGQLQWVAATLGDIASTVL